MSIWLEDGESVRFFADRTEIRKRNGELTVRPPIPQPQNTAQQLREWWALEKIAEPSIEARRYLIAAAESIGPSNGMDPEMYERNLAITAFRVGGWSRRKLSVAFGVSQSRIATIERAVFRRGTWASTAVVPVRDLAKAGSVEHMLVAVDALLQSVEIG